MNRDPDESSVLDVSRFFDRLTGDYTEVIERCFPRYPEMLWALLTYLPSQSPPTEILELGCGTGNLSTLLVDSFANSQVTLVDVSTESLQTCRQRLPSDPRLRYLDADFRDLVFDDSRFDLVISSIAIHHLRSDEKKTLFGRIHRWLAEDGVFAYADQHAGATEALNQKHINLWRSLSESAGSTAAEWKMWMDHQREHDHHDTLLDQVDWLRESGFNLIDCPWRYLLWTVLICQK